MYSMRTIACEEHPDVNSRRSIVRQYLLFPLGSPRDDQPELRQGLGKKDKRLDQIFQPFVGCNVPEEQYDLVFVRQTQTSTCLRNRQGRGGHGAVDPEGNDADLPGCDPEVRLELAFHLLGVDKQMMYKLILDF